LYHLVNGVIPGHTLCAYALIAVPGAGPRWSLSSAWPPTCVSAQPCAAADAMAANGLSWSRT